MPDLLTVYRAVYGDEITIANLDEMANDLSQIAGRQQQWTGKFLHSLIKGYNGFRMSRQLQSALDLLVSRPMSNGERLLADNLPKGVILMYPPQKCAAVGCRETFVRGAWNQKYCGKECRNLMRKLRRRNKRYARF